MGKKRKVVRLDSKGNPYDIVVSCDSIHIGRINNNFWCIEITKGNKVVVIDLIPTTAGIEASIVGDQIKLKREKSQ